MTYYRQYTAAATVEQADFDRMTVLLQPGANANSEKCVVAYESDFKGKTYFHLQHLGVNDRGEYTYGKGIAVTVDRKAALLDALAAYIQAQQVPA